MQTDTENTGDADRADEVHFTGDNDSTSDNPNDNPNDNPTDKSTANPTEHPADNQSSPEQHSRKIIPSYLHIILSHGIK